MQDDEVDIVAALTSLLKTLHEMETLSSKPLTQWPTYSATKKNYQGKREKMLYQSQEVKSYGQAEKYCLAHHEDICKRVSECIKARLGWSDLQLMRNVLLILNTQGWEKLIKEKYHLEELLQLISRFKIPLEGAGADTEEIYKEFEEIMEYTVNFISLSTLDYSSVWWRLFHCPSRSEWANALILIELLFSLPASNGKVERVFSTSNVIKVEKFLIIK